MSNLAPSIPKKPISQAKIDALIKARSAIKSKNRTQKGEDNLIVLLIFIAKFGISTRRVASYFVGDSQGRVIRRAIKLGLIRTVELERACKTLQFGVEQAVIALTQEGYQRVTEEGLDLAYPEIHNQRINYAQVSHNLTIQLVLKGLLSSGNAVSFLTERMYGVEDQEGIKRFDAISIDQEGRKMGIEVELTPKDGRSYCLMRRRIVRAILGDERYQAGEISLVYVYLNAANRLRYQVGLSAKAKIYSWVKSAANKWVKSSNSPYLIPDTVATRIIFPKMPGE
jgi:hypothetical protein